MNSDEAQREMLSTLLFDLGRTTISPDSALDRFDLSHWDESIALSDDDYQLIFAWAGNPCRWSQEKNRRTLFDEIGIYEASRLISARIAELFVIKYFRALGQTVEDISRFQIQTYPIDSRWKDFDILVDGRPIDVKNARRVRETGRYVEHCVPRFKLARGTLDEVSVLGVLSDYIVFNLDKKPNSLTYGPSSGPLSDHNSHEHHNCLVLGETNVQQMRELYAWLARRFGKIIDFAGLWKPNFQPSWVFEYSDVFYRVRLAAIERIEDVLRHTSSNPLMTDHVPLWLWALCPNKCLADEKRLTSTQRQIFDDLFDLREAVGYSRPSLYAYSMAYILESLALGRNWDAVLSLRSILFGKESSECVYDLNSPLSLCDPLSMVYGLFDSCEYVYLAAVKNGAEFVGFKLHHPAVMKGMLSSGKWITLLSYCGGRNMATSKWCNNGALVFGKQKTCEKCGYLVCERCGCCSPECN